MKKLTTAALAGLVAVAATANASVSRWDGFGGIGAAFIADVQDIWTLPGAVTGYKNALYTELGGSSYSSDVWGGAHFELGPGVLAVWGNRPSTIANHLNNFYVPGNNDNVGNQPNESVDVIYGFNLSDSTTLAVGVNRSQYSRGWKNEEPSNNWEESDTTGLLGLTLGWEQKDLGPIGLLEVGLQFSLINGQVDYKDNDASTETKSTVSGSQTNLRIGGDLPGSEGKFGRFEVGFAMDGESNKSENTPAIPSGVHAEDTYSGMGYNLGYAAGKSGDKGLGLVGAMLTGRADSMIGKNEDGSGLDHKREYGMYTLALGFAGEGKVADWLTVRGGLSANVLHNTSRVRTNGAGDKYTNSTTEYGDWFDVYGGQNATASFGTSLTFGNLTIDGVLDQDLLWDGAYFVTGSSAGGLNTEVSATWAY